MSKKFAFELGADIALAFSKEKGVVIGRAQYDNGNENAYFIRYVTADGRQVEGWRNESAVAAVAASAKPAKETKALKDDDTKSAPAKGKKGKAAPVDEDEDEDDADETEDADEDEDEDEGDEDETEDADEDEGDEDEDEDEGDEEEADAPDYDEVVAPAAQKYLKAKGKPALAAILKTFKAKTVADLKETQYAKFIEAVKLKKKKVA